MAWTDIEEDVFKAGKLAVNLDLANIQDNLTFMHDRNYEAYLHDGTGGNHTTTSTTLTPVDDSKYRLTIVTTGGPLLTMFHASMHRQNASEGYVFITIVREDNPLDLAYANFPFWVVRAKPITIIKPYTDLPPGQYTFNVQWMVVGGTQQAVIFAASKPFFMVMEGI